MTQSYPLHWPSHWKRTREHNRKSATFRKKDGKKERRVNPLDAFERIEQQTRLLGVDKFILSTNLELRVDGVPRRDRGEPEDPGAALYFKMDGKDTVFACDKWDRVSDNIAAIAAHIDAIRRQERYGVGDLEQAFAGYQQLPPRFIVRFWSILGVSEDATLDECEKAYKEKSKKAHPDNGGTHEEMALLNAAIDEARKVAKK